jgi:serine/threonine protein kinase
VDVLIGRNLGQYRIVQKIGEGGMATVYKAFQPTLDRYVAIKVLPPLHADRPEFGERFEREAKAIAQLHHPNIVPIYDFGQDGDYRFLVMRYIDGATTLRDLMKTSLSLTQVTDLVGQVAAALGHAHRQGIIHRDVKPSNVMMDGQWALLTDFGLARMAEALVELTGSGIGIGTPAYMSPEQGRGLAVDHRSDIYSLGIILFEMLTGQIPHNADTPFAVVFRRITEPLPMPRTLNPGIPEDVEQVVLKALATEPAHRFEAADEMAQALQRRQPGKISFSAAVPPTMRI